MMISPEQCRAARALLDWTQEDLEVRSQIAKKAIADFERGSQIPYRKNLDQIKYALEVGGVIFIPENGGGVGVRKNAAVPRFARKRINRFDHVATVVINYRAQEFRVDLPTEVLDDFDRTNHETDAAYDKALDKHMNMILLRAAKAIDAGRGGDAHYVILTVEDFLREI